MGWILTLRAFKQEVNSCLQLIHDNEELELHKATKLHVKMSSSELMLPN